MSSDEDLFTTAKKLKKNEEESVTENLLEEVTEIEKLEDEEEDDDNGEEEKNSSSLKPNVSSSEMTEMMNKTRMMNRLLQELQRRELKSAGMQKQINILTEKLKESTELIEKTNEEYSHLKLRVVEAEALKTENERMKLRLSELVNQNEQRIGKDDEIIAAVNHRVEQWKAVFVAKEVTIMQQQNEIERLKESVAVNSSVHSSNTTALLSKALKAKELEVSELSCELKSATLELESATITIEKLKEATVKEDDYYKKQLLVVRRKLTAAVSAEEVLKKSLNEVETSAAKKEKELAEALAQVKAYEMSEFGLADAVQEIKRLKQSLNIRDRQIEELTLTADQMEIALVSLKDDNDQLRAKLGLNIDDQQLNDFISSFRQSLTPTKSSLANVIKKRVHESEMAGDEAVESNVLLNEISQEVRLLQNELKELKKSASLRSSTVEITEESVEAEDRKIKQLQNEMKHTDSAIEKLSKKSLFMVESSTQTEMEAKNDAFSYVDQLNTLISRYYQKLEEDYSVNLSQSEDDLIKSNDDVEDLMDQYKKMCETVIEGKSDVIKSELAELNRKYTLKKVNELKLKRKCLYLMESDAILRKKLLKVENDMSSICNDRLNRIRYLEQLKQMTAYKLESMRRHMEEELVSKSQLRFQEKMTNQLTEQRTQLIQLVEQTLKITNGDVLKLFKADETVSDAFDDRSEAELRAELEECKTEKYLLVNELSQLKQTNEIAENQLNAMKLFNLSKNLEVENLRRQLNKENESDDSQLARKLYMEILNLQLNEMNLQSKLESCQKQANKIETFSFRLEQICDEKDQELYRGSLAAYNKVNRLRSIVKQLLLERAERKGALAVAELQLKAERAILDETLDHLHEQKKELKLKRVELQTKTNGLDFELKALKNRNDVSAFLSQSNKLTELRIQNEKQLSELQRVSDDLERSNVLRKQMEGKLADLHEELTSLKTNQWQKEIEMDQQQYFMSHEKQFQSFISEKLVEKEEKQPKINFKQRSVELKEKQEEIKQLLKSEKEALKRIEELEIALSARDQVISSFTAKQKLGPSETEVKVEAKLETNLSECVVETLKARLKQKEETLSKYKQLLENAQQEMLKMAERSKEATVKFSEQLEPVSTVEKISAWQDKKPSEQLSRLSELEEITTQQDNAIVILAEKLKTSSKEIQKLRIELENSTETHQQEKQKLLCELEAEMKEVKIRLEESKMTEEKLTAELHEKQFNSRTDLSAPVSNRNAAGQLRQKDKEIQSLSRTIVSLNEKMKSLVVEARSTKDSCQECSTYQKEIEALKKKLKAQDALNDQIKKMETNFDKQLIVCTQLKKENTRLHQLLEKQETKLKLAEPSGTAELNKLKLELREALRQSSQLKMQVDRYKKAKSNEDEVKGNVELNVKIKQLMDEIDELMNKVKEAYLNRQEATALSAVDDFEMILSREAELRREIDGLQQENCQLKLELQRESALESAIAGQRESVKWLKEKLSVGVLSDSVAAKMVQHNEKLLHNYNREKKSNEKLKIQLHLSDVENQRLTQLLSKHKISNTTLA